MPPFRGFAPSNDGRRCVSLELWETYRQEIERLFIYENRTLEELMEIMAQNGFPRKRNVWSTQLTKWRFQKRKRKPKVQVISVEIRVRGSLRLQEIVICRLGTILTNDLDQERRGIAISSNSIPYDESDVGHSIEDIIQGCDMIRQNHIKQGGAVLRKGFETIESIFEQHGLHAMVDLLSNLHIYCDKKIVTVLWRHLYDLSRKHNLEGHPLYEILEQLKDFSSSEEFAPRYQEVMEETVNLLHKHLKDKGAQADPSLLFLMSTSPSPLDPVFREYARYSMNQTRSSLRAKFGITHINYLEWLWRHLDGFRVMFGDSSDEAFTLASHMLREVEYMEQNHPYSFFECKLTEAEYHWRKWEETHEKTNPQATLAISLMEKFTQYREKIQMTDAYLLHLLVKLADWQKTAGHELDASVTELRHNHILEGLRMFKVRDWRENVNTTETTSLDSLPRSAKDGEASRGAR